MGYDREFEKWYGDLMELGMIHDEPIHDRDFWEAMFSSGKSPAEAFFGEFPEHRLDFGS